MSSRRGRSSLFLIELILTVFIFSLASAFCVRLLVYSHSMTGQAGLQSSQTAAAQTLAETFIAADGDASEMGRLLAGRIGADTAAGTGTDAGSGTAAASDGKTQAPVSGTAADVQSLTVYYDSGWSMQSVRIGTQKAQDSQQKAPYRAELTVTGKTDGIASLSINLLSRDGKLLFHLEADQYTGKEAADE
ncbi:MAG: hypothetical protein LKJ76_03580 [Lachnospiraceae bacterium]|jgi:hypothetical protein|nr:hypothetical protein [Lachnospiraceae bacterium]